jgi:pimeloyl-ACP methyl ester carboxylesterase
MPTIETNSFETYYERRGSGRSIVFAHGSGWDYRSWAPQLEGLAPDYEVIAYDYRGHGRTGGTDEGWESIERLADDLYALVEALELESPVVGGCSLGGEIAYRCAARYPESVGGLITHEAPRPDGDRSVAERIQLATFRVLSRLVSPRRGYEIQLWLMSILGDDEDVQRAARYIPSLETTGKEYVVDAAYRMDAAEQRKLLDAERPSVDLSNISVPALILTGENPGDRFEEAADELAERIPDAQRGRIPDAGHGAHMTNPVAFNAEVRRFLKQRSI